jgi:hypothetical protein
MLPFTFAEFVRADPKSSQTLHLFQTPVWLSQGKKRGLDLLQLERIPYQ